MSKEHSISSADNSQISSEKSQQTSAQRDFLRGSVEKIVQEFISSSSDGEIERRSQGFEDSGFPTTEKGDCESSYRNEETMIDRHVVSKCC